MSRKKWVTSHCDRECAREIAEECDIDALVALILVSRGFTDPFEVDELLSDDQQLSDPYELIDMDKAVGRLHQALENRERICVYGDYDADGVTSTAMLYTYLLSKNALVSFIVPEREENYGLNKNAVDRMAQAGVRLMITVDNGISAVEEIDYANSKGIDVVVTDHHLPQSRLPAAVAVVDPHRLDCPSTFKEYAGAGVCFKFICAAEGVSGEEMCDRFADLAAVGTIADVMPLIGENRIIARRGVERLMSTREGFKAIINAACLAKRGVNALTVSYGIAPRLNAAGRVGSCVRAVELLIESDPKRAAAIASEINDANTQRQSLERTISEQAMSLIEQQQLCFDRVIVVAGEGWHHGVIGIVASRICDKYGKPAIVLVDDGTTASGSARSVGEFSLYAAISSCAGLLERFGGHAQAAGLSMPRGNVAAFRRKINEYAAKEYGDMPFAELSIDCKLRPTAFTPDMVHSLEVLAPFGAGNAVPVFGLFGMRLDRVTAVGSQGSHLRLEVSRDDMKTTVMYFGCTAERFGYDTGDRLDFAVTADVGEYSGREQVTLTVRGVRASEGDDDALLRDIRLYERLRRKEDISGLREDFLLTRDDVAAAYRSVRRGFDGDCEALMLHSKLGYLKLRLALDVLDELGLANIKWNMSAVSVQIADATRKFDLDESPLYNRLSSL